MSDISKYRIFNISEQPIYRNVGFAMYRKTELIFALHQLATPPCISYDDTERKVSTCRLGIDVPNMGGIKPLV